MTITYYDLTEEAGEYFWMNYKHRFFLKMEQDLLLPEGSSTAICIARLKEDPYVVYISTDEHPGYCDAKYIKIKTQASQKQLGDYFENINLRA